MQTVTRIFEMLLLLMLRRMLLRFDALSSSRSVVYFCFQYGARLFSRISAAALLSLGSDW